MSFKICSIGCGRHANNMHGPSYRRYAKQNSDITLAACCDIDPQAAEEFQKNFGFQKYYTDIREMLETERPNAVSLVAPVELTAKLAAQVLEMGYPLILEKPPGRDGEEVQRLADIAKEKGVPNQVALNRRYDPLISKLKHLIDENLKPEEIHSIRCDFYRVRRATEDFSTTAIHGIDAVRFLAGSDYREINFRYQELPNISENAVNVYMDCIFESGATAQLNILPVAGVRIERYTVNAYDHTFFANVPMWFEHDAPGRLIHLRQNNLQLDITGEDVSDGDELFETCGFYAENKAFFDAIKNGIKPYPDLQASVQSVVVADCIRNRLPKYTIQQ